MMDDVQNKLDEQEEEIRSMRCLLKILFNYHIAKEDLGAVLMHEMKRYADKVE